MFNPTLGLPSHYTSIFLASPKYGHAFPSALNPSLLPCAQMQGGYGSPSSITFGLWQVGRLGLVDDITSLASPCSNIASIATVVQTDLVNLNEWVDAGGKALCNIMNIVRTAPDETTAATMMEQVEVYLLDNYPYFMPSAAPEELNSIVEVLTTTNLVRLEFQRASVSRP